MTVRTRRRIMRVTIAVSFLALVALLAVPQLRRHDLGGGWGIAVSAVVSILGGLYYLHTSRRAS